MGFLKSESYKKGIFYSTLFNFGAKGLGFVNSLLIVFFFGSNFKTDLYFLILATVTLVTSFINSVDLLVIIPQAMRLRVEKGLKEEFSFLNFFLFTYVGIGLLFCVLVAVAPPWFFSFFSKYTFAELESQRLMLFLSALLMPLQLLNSFYVSILTSHKYFTVPMVVSLVNSMISITLLVFLKNQFSVTSAIIAQIAGFSVNFLWLTLSVNKRLQWNFFSGIIMPSQRVFKNIGLLQLNLIPVSLRSYITIYLLSGLGAGIITALNYGQQISMIPEMLLTTQIIAVTGIKFNELSSKDDKPGLNRFFISLLNILVLLMLPIGVLLAVNANEIVSVIFTYAKKLDASMLDQLALCIFFLSLTLPARALDLVMTRLITAQQKIKEGVVYAIIMHTAITVLVFIGITLYGLKGYLIATLAGYNVLLPLLYFLLVKKATPFIEYGLWLTNTLKFVAFNIVLIAILFGLKISVFHAFHPLLKIITISLLYTLAVLCYNQLAGYVPMNNALKKLVFKK